MFVLLWSVFFFPTTTMISALSAMMKGQAKHVMTKVAIGLIWSSFQTIMGRLEQCKDGDSCFYWYLVAAESKKHVMSLQILLWINARSLLPNNFAFVSFLLKMKEIENALELEDANIFISSIFLLRNIILCYNTFTKHKTNKRERQLFHKIENPWLK